jgi:ABC-2 type transport system ATP-binding protein
MTIPAADPAPQPVVLRALGLRRNFGKVTAVDGLDLTVRAGEIYGFLGVNGAGKTTAIRLFMGILKADGGTLELLGEATRRTSIRQKQSIGYVSQEQTFYPWMTCRMLGRFVGGLYPSWDAAEFERLLGVLDLPPDRKASQLSGGMRVKLALALALAPRPPLLILDEPTSGLDPLARREFLDIIQRETREHGRTTFFSSHIIGEIERVADRVGIVHRGRMRFEGSLAELKASVRLAQIGASPAPADAAPLSTSPSPPPLPGASSISVSIAPPGDVPPTQPIPTLAAVASVPQPETTAMAAEGAPSATASGSNGAWTDPRFEVLRDETHAGVRSLVLKAAPEAWLDLPPGAEVRELSVEDIFVALVGKGAIVA